jgi:Mor family transcriptional regulator
MLTNAFQEEFGYSKTKAQGAAEKIIEWGAKNGLSGSEHYWPCRYKRMTARERDEAIRQKFRGNNLKEVCTEFGVSHETVYRAIRA